MKKCRAHTMTHDYKRHGTTTLFAALNTLDGSVSLHATSGSWLNMVERFFRDLTENQLRRGVFTSVEALQECILAYIEGHNRQPKPFIWTAKATDILEKLKRAKAKLNNSPSV